MSAESELPRTPSIIANLPPGAFWTRENGVPQEECERASQKLAAAECLGVREWWMTYRRMVN